MQHDIATMKHKLVAAQTDENEQQQSANDGKVKDYVAIPIISTNDEPQSSRNVSSDGTTNEQESINLKRALMNNGDMGKIEEILARAPQVINIPFEEEGLTPIVFAIKNQLGIATIAKLIERVSEDELISCKKGGSSSTTTTTTTTPLYEAMMQCNVGVIKLILDKAPNATRVPLVEKGDTPLVFAIKQDLRYDITRELIERMSEDEIVIPNREGAAPLYVAMERGKLDVMKLILDKAPKAITTPVGIQGDKSVPLVLDIKGNMRIPIIQHLIEYTPGEQLAISPVEGQFSPLYHALVVEEWSSDSWGVIQHILKKVPDAISTRIGEEDGDTPPIVAIKHGLDPDIVEELIKLRVNRHQHQPLSFKEGTSALLWSAFWGRLPIAKLLITNIDQGLANEASHDSKKILPFELAASQGHWDMCYYLLSVTSKHLTLQKHNACNVLGHAILDGKYDLALRLLPRYNSMSVNVVCGLLELLIEQPHAFASGTKFNNLTSIIYSSIPVDSSTVNEVLNKNPTDWAEIYSRVEPGSDILFSMPLIKKLYRTKLEHCQALELVKSLCKQIKKVCKCKQNGTTFAGPHFLSAVRNGILLEVVEAMLEEFPDLIKYNCQEDGEGGNKGSSSKSPLKLSPVLESKIKRVRRKKNNAYGRKDQLSGGASSSSKNKGSAGDRKEYGKNALQLAVEYRHGKMFMMLHQRIKRKEPQDFPKRGLKHFQDYYGDHFLHLVARRPRITNVDAASQAVLQVQHELLWYTEVQNSLPPQLRLGKDKKGQLPIDVFVEEHAEMVSVERDWIQSMSNACLVAGVLIATVVFAASITVPGGNKENGRPNFHNRKAFYVFGVSNSLSLVFSLTAVVLFLSIFTNRYSIDDFRRHLPERLIFGSISLLLSLIFMMVAFSSTTYLLFSNRQRRVLYPTSAVAGIPVLFFLLLQLRPLANMIRYTYGGPILKLEEYKGRTSTKDGRK